MNNQQPHNDIQQSAGERLAESMKERRTRTTTSSDVSRPMGPKPSGGVNKYIIIAAVLALLLIGGALYSVFISDRERVVETGVTRNITITTHTDTWSFDPEEIEVNQGDRVHLTIINKDDYDHGFAIDSYGISQRMPARGTIEVEFVATRAGVFPYYCSVSCGSGIVDGEERGHFDQIGRLLVRSMVRDTTDFTEFSDEELREQARTAAIKVAADSVAAELGFDPGELTFVFDRENAAWAQHRADTSNISHEATEDALKTITHYTVYYTDSNEEIVLWVFIDDDTGDIITHEE